MKKATTSIDGVALEPLAQGAHVVGGAPGDVQHAHALARATWNVTRRRSLSGMVSPDGGAIATSTMRAPARSSVTVRSSVALPSLTFATPEASTVGGPSSRSSRAVTVRSSHGQARAADLDAQGQRHVRDGRTRRR